MGFGEFVDALDYSLLVVTAVHAETGERSGCLVGFATQCGIEPARFLVCVSQANHTHHVALASPVLAVHALAAEHHDLARLFGEHTGDDADKFARCRWEPGVGGVPLLTDCPRRFVGRPLHRLDNLGDHTGFVLAPVETNPRGPGSTLRPEPLLFSRARDLEAGHPA